MAVTGVTSVTDRTAQAAEDTVRLLFRIAGIFTEAIKVTAIKLDELVDALGRKKNGE